MPADGLGQPTRADAAFVALPRGVNVGKIHTVAVVKCPGELPEQPGRPAVGVRLIGAQHPAKAQLPRSGQSGPDGGGMVGVVVVHGSPVETAAVLHAAVHPAKGGKPLRNLLRGGPAEKGRGGGRQCIDHLKPARLPERYPADGLFFAAKNKLPAAPPGGHLRRPEIRRPACAEGAEPPAVGLQRPHQLGVLGVRQYAALRAGALGKAQEGGAELFHAVKIIDMVHADVEQHRQGRVEIQKGIPVLAGFKHHLLPPLADAAAGPTQGWQLGPAQHGGVAAGQQNLRAHGGGGTLAIHARHPDAGAVAQHQISEVIGTGNQGQAGLPGGQILGVLFPDGNGVDHRIRSADPFGAVPDVNVGPQPAQPPEALAVGPVRPGHAQSLPQRNFGQRAHAHPARADEMNRPAIPQQLPQALRPQMCI